MTTDTRPRLRAVIADHLRHGADPRELAAAMVRAHAEDCRAEEPDVFSADEGVSHAARWGRR